MHFIDLPTSIVEEVLVLCDPIEVAKASQTCYALRTLIYDSQDSKLWRDLYLAQQFDDLRRCISPNGQPPGPPDQIDWKRSLQRLVRAGKIVGHLSLLRPGELEGILQTLLRMILYHSPWSLNTDKSGPSLNLVWVSDILQHGFIDQVEEMKPLTFAERQLISRLHCCYGLTQRDMERQARVNSRVYVYTISNYRFENDYGPFFSNGSVNWEHVQALHHVVSMHLVDMGEEGEFEFPVFPMSLPQMRMMIPLVTDGEESKGDKGLDWIGLEGLWALSFCFCDHRDLLRFNEASARQLDTSLFEDPEFREVFRSLEVKLHLTRVEHNPTYPMRPILYFFGDIEGSSMNDQVNRMNGQVKMTVDNQVQWSFISGNQDNAIWSCQGVQVGGLRSSFGVLGSWTTVFHDIDDPVGPFWFRKCD